MCLPVWDIKSTSRCARVAKKVLKRMMFRSFGENSAKMKWEMFSMTELSLRINMKGNTQTQTLIDKKRLYSTKVRGMKIPNGEFKPGRNYCPLNIIDSKRGLLWVLYLGENVFEHDIYGEYDKLHRALVIISENQFFSNNTYRHNNSTMNDKKR